MGCSIIKSSPIVEVHSIYDGFDIWLASDRRAGPDRSEGALQTGTFEHDVQTKNVPIPYSAMQFPMTKEPHVWKKRPRSPGLKWHKDYDSPASLKKGRIFVIDYVKQGETLQNEKYLRSCCVVLMLYV